jgi:hypothetical protein
MIVSLKRKNKVMIKVQAGFFDEQFTLERISMLGDPLEKLNRAIDWELFRYTLDNHLANEAKGPGGRPDYDYIKLRSQVSGFALTCV